MFENWAQNHRSQPTERIQIQGVDDALRAVERARDTGRNLRCVGAGHSWSDIACTDGILVSLDSMNQILDIDHTTHRVRVQAGARLKDLNQELAARGLGFKNLGSVAEQSLAGATSTGTHGSGIGFGSLSSTITALQLVTGSGELLDVDRNDPRFPGLALGLGALGILTEIEFEAEPAFNLEETRWSLPFEQALSQMDELVAEHEHIKFWWLPHTNDVAVFAANRTDAPLAPPSRLTRAADEMANDHIFTKILSAGKKAPALIPSLNRALNSVYLRPGQNIDRSDRIFCLAMPPRHLEIEYGVPALHAVEILRETRKLIKQKKLNVNFIQEVRFVQADDLWLSNSYGRDSCQFGAYCGYTRDAEAYFSGVAEIARGLSGRPHWGKSFDEARTFMEVSYPKWDSFSELRNALDPAGIFANTFITRLFDAAG